MELAVNIPEQEPQVGQEQCSISCRSLSDMVVSAALTMASIRSRCWSFQTPASIGPPETKMVGMFRRMVASSMPGVILSQLLMQTSASALWALTMYSTLSAMRSLDGKE